MSKKAGRKRKVALEQRQGAGKGEHLERVKKERNRKKIEKKEK